MALIVMKDDHVRYRRGLMFTSPSSFLKSLDAIKRYDTDRSTVGSNSGSLSKQKYTASALYLSL